MNKTLVEDGHLGGEKVEVEAAEDGAEGGDCDEAVGDTRLKQTHRVANGSGVF